MWGLTLSGRAMAAIALTGAGIVILGLLVWRLSYLSDKVDTLEIENTRYKAAFKALQEGEELRAALAFADNRDTLANERSRSELIGLIEGTKNEEDGPVAPVLAHTIERLFSQPGTGDN